MRNKNLDGIRGLAALCVAVGHCETHYGGAVLLGLKAADLIHAPIAVAAARLWYTVFHADAAVILFFALSGYVLSRTLESRCDAPIHALGPYLLKRVFRLFPASIAAGLVLALVAHLNWKTTLGHMFLVDNSVNGPIWSLQIELIGCLVVFVLWAANSRLFALATIVAMTIFNYFCPLLQVMFLPIFALGYLVPAVPARVWRSKALLFASLAVLVLADLLIRDATKIRAAEAFAAFGVVGCLTSRKINLLHSRPVQFLGDISYPFYLCGIASLILAAPWADAIIREPAMIRQAAMLAMLSVPTCIAAAWVIHRLVEVPGIRLGNQLLTYYSRPRTAIPWPAWNLIVEAPRIAQPAGQRLRPGPARVAPFERVSTS